MIGQLDECHDAQMVCIFMADGIGRHVRDNEVGLFLLHDVREMIARLRADGRAQEINTITHGNAWSVYFRDPEQNGIEIFCDTPWHVAQPALEPWDEKTSDDELRAATLAKFEDRESFGPMEEYVRKRKQELADR